jgi:hypothetical protein
LENGMLAPVGIPFSKMSYIVLKFFSCDTLWVSSRYPPGIREIENKNHHCLHHVMPSAMGIIRIRPASDLPHRCPYSGNAYPHIMWNELH